MNYRNGTEGNKSQVVGGYVLRDVEQVVRMERDRSVLVCWKNGSSQMVKAGQADELWTMCLETDMVPGINGDRLVRPYRLDLIKR